MNFTTTFTLQSADGTEHSITVEAEFTQGARAETDNYGRPTECATDDEWVFLYLSIDGKEAEFSNETASLFVRYNWVNNEWLPMDLEDFQDACKDFLIAERDCPETVDDLPF